MKKRLSKSIAAIACAALMASQMVAFDASAAIANGGHYYYYNGVYYSSADDATNAANGNSGAWVAVPEDRVPDSAVLKYYDPLTGRQYNTLDEAKKAGVLNPSVIYIGSYNGYNGYNGYYGYYSSYTKKYYNTYQEALNASLGISSYVTYVGYNDYYGYGYGYGYGYDYGLYYSSYTKKYYYSYAEALAASKGMSSYVTYVGYAYRYYDGVPGSIYRYYYNGVAYPTLQAAIDAGGTVGVDIYYSPTGSQGDVKYYYYYKGTYYGSLQAAINAGGTAVGVDISYVPYGYFGNQTMYNAPYYNGYYGYYNPFGYNNIFADKDTGDKAEDGEPYIYGRNTKAGWKTIVKYINAASKGSNIKVDMNGCTVVDDSVLEAIDGRNVSVTFVLENGTKWTINGKKVTDPQDINIYTEYNIDYIPSSLVKKASKNSISKAQIGVSTTFSDFGAKANVTVKFSSKRAGCTAVVYRYDPDTNSLKGVCKSKVQSNGSCTFTAEQGGPYLIVLK